LDWKLAAGGLLLANFGTNFEDARTALAAVRYYRFTEQLHAGDAGRPVCYYLTNAQSPHGLMFGLPAEMFDPEKVAIQKSPDGCCLADGQHVLLRMGERKDQAEKLLESIHRNKYDRL